MGCDRKLELQNKLKGVQFSKIYLTSFDAIEIIFTIRFQPRLGIKEHILLAAYSKGKS